MSTATRKRITAGTLMFFKVKPSLRRRQAGESKVPLGKFDSRRSSSKHPSPAYVQHLAGDKRRLLRGKKPDRRSHVLSCGRTSHGEASVRNSQRFLAREFLVVDDGGIHHVDRNAVPGFL